jgi:hypothetical protein
MLRVYLSKLIKLLHKRKLYLSSKYGIIDLKKSNNK